MKNSNRISLLIASDHAGFLLKQWLIKNMTAVNWIDLGPDSSDRCDYPDYAKKLGHKIKRQTPRGVLICGSGIGMSIAANKVHGVRAAVVESTKTARLAKEHNDANVLCLGARIVTKSYAKKIIHAWTCATFEGGRHSKRIQKITKLEKSS